MDEAKVKVEGGNAGVPRPSISNNMKKEKKIVIPVDGRYNQAVFEKMFKQLAEFRDATGTLDVPNKGKTAELAHWLEERRHELGRKRNDPTTDTTIVDEYRIVKLENLGVTWPVLSGSPQNSRPPKRTTHNSAKASSNADLARNREAETAPRPAQTNLVGKQTNKEKWETRRCQLVEFKAKHGHIRVPDGLNGLGTWLRHQKRTLNFRRFWPKEKLKEKDIYRIRILEELGIEWPSPTNDATNVNRAQPGAKKRKKAPSASSKAAPKAKEAKQVRTLTNVDLGPVLGAAIKQDGPHDRDGGNVENSIQLLDDDEEEEKEGNINVIKNRTSGTNMSRSTKLSEPKYLSMKGLVQNYHRMHGHARVREGPGGQHGLLAGWVEEQKQKMKGFLSGTLIAEDTDVAQAYELDSLGVFDDQGVLALIRDLSDYAWNFLFSVMVCYRDAHQDCKVQRGMDGQHSLISTWMEHERSEYRRIETNYDEAYVERLTKLDGIGFFAAASDDNIKTEQVQPGTPTPAITFEATQDNVPTTSEGNMKEDVVVEAFNEAKTKTEISIKEDPCSTNDQNYAASANDEHAHVGNIAVASPRRVSLLRSSPDGETEALGLSGETWQTNTGDSTPRRVSQPKECLEEESKLKTQGGDEESELRVSKLEEGLVEEPDSKAQDRDKDGELHPRERSPLFQHKRKKLEIEQQRNLSQKNSKTVNVPSHIEDNLCKELRNDPNANELPTLRLNWLYSPDGQARCHHFETTGNCRYETRCRFAHCFTQQNQFRSGEGIRESKIRYENSRDSGGHVWFTAGYAEGNEYLYASGGDGCCNENTGVWWYRSECAAKNAILATHGGAQHEESANLCDRAQLVVRPFVPRDWLSRDSRHHWTPCKYMGTRLGCTQIKFCRFAHVYYELDHIPLLHPFKEQQLRVIGRADQDGTVRYTSGYSEDNKYFHVYGDGGLRCMQTGLYWYTTPQEAWTAMRSLLFPPV